MICANPAGLTIDLRAFTWCKPRLCAAERQEQRGIDEHGARTFRNGVAQFDVREKGQVDGRAELASVENAAAMPSTSKRVRKKRGAPQQSSR